PAQHFFRGLSSMKTMPGSALTGAASRAGATPSPQYLQVVEFAAIVSAQAGQARDMVLPQLAQRATAGSALALQNGQASIMLTTSGNWTDVYCSCNAEICEIQSGIDRSQHKGFRAHTGRAFLDEEGLHDTVLG